MDKMVFTRLILGSTPKGEICRLVKRIKEKESSILPNAISFAILSLNTSGCSLADFNVSAQMKSLC